MLDRTISNILKRRKLAEVLSWICLAASLQTKWLPLKPGHSVDVSLYLGSILDRPTNSTSALSS